MRAVSILVAQTIMEILIFRYTRLNFFLISSDLFVYAVLTSENQLNLNNCDENPYVEKPIKGGLLKH